MTSQRRAKKALKFWSVPPLFSVMGSKEAMDQTKQSAYPHDKVEVTEYRGPKKTLLSVLKRAMKGEQ